MCGPCAFPTRTGAVFVWADSRGFVLKNENEKARYAPNKAKKLKIKKGQQEDATRAIALAAPLRGARIPARFSAESPPRGAPHSRADPPTVPCFPPQGHPEPGGGGLTWGGGGAACPPAWERRHAWERGAPYPGRPRCLRAASAPGGAAIYREAALKKDF